MTTDVILQGLSLVQFTLSTTMGGSRSNSSRRIELTTSSLRFYCEGRTLTAYTLTTLASAIAGSYLPFQKWFNERHNKVSPNPLPFADRVRLTCLMLQGWRIAFFLSISFTAIAPLSHLAYAHGFKTMLRFAGACNGSPDDSLFS